MHVNAAIYASITNQREDTQVRDHCRITSTFRSAPCDQCNTHMCLIAFFQIFHAFKGIGLSLNL